MERRKFVVGLGALASGSAAAVGTGAFTSVTAERSVSVTVAGDNSAYLGLSAVGPNSDYVDKSSGEVSISLDGLEDSSSGSGTGVNPDATTVIEECLRIENQGTQEVELDLTGTGVVSAGTSDPGADSDTVGIYIDNTSSSATEVDDDTAQLPVGEYVDLSVEVETSSGTGTLSGTLTVEANADSDSGESAGPS